jgi:hypothetical protein
MSEGVCACVNVCQRVKGGGGVGEGGGGRCTETIAHMRADAANLRLCCLGFQRLHVLVGAGQLLEHCRQFGLQLGHLLTESGRRLGLFLAKSLWRHTAPAHTGTHENTDQHSHANTHEEAQARGRGQPFLANVTLPPQVLLPLRAPASRAGAGRAGHALASCNSASIRATSALASAASVSWRRASACDTNDRRYLASRCHNHKTPAGTRGAACSMLHTWASASCAARAARSSWSPFALVVPAVARV